MKLLTIITLKQEAEIQQQSSCCILRDVFELQNMHSVSY